MIRNGTRLILIFLLMSHSGCVGFNFGREKNGTIHPIDEARRLEEGKSTFKETLEKSGAKGKKLGFIAQEMGREINTIGSKANHAEMQRNVILMKDNLERIKEQVLNVL